MATTNYTATWNKTSPFSATLRCRCVSTFNPATRKSSVVITPQLKTTVNYGNDYRLYAANATNCGIFGDGTNLYQFGSNYGSGNYAQCGSAHSSYATFNKSGTLVVSHEDDGTATFTAGVYGTVRQMYSSTQVTNLGSRTGSSITITNFSVIYHAKYVNEILTPNAEEITSATQTVSEQIPVLQPLAVGSNPDTTTFLGWSTDPDATTPEFLPGDEFGAVQNFDLYSVWQEATSGSIYIDNGTSFEEYSIYIDDGTSFSQYKAYIDNGTSWDPYPS